MHSSRFFHWKKQWVSEDRWFWEQVKAKTNYPILVDPQIQLGHIGRMIFDKNMYVSWRETYKKLMKEQIGEEQFNKKWSQNAIATPYKEVKVYGKTKLKKVKV